MQQMHRNRDPRTRASTSHTVATFNIRIRVPRLREFDQKRKLTIHAAPHLGSAFRSSDVDIKPEISSRAKIFDSTHSIQSSGLWMMAKYCGGAAYERMCAQYMRK